MAAGMVFMWICQGEEGALVPAPQPPAGAALATAAAAVRHVEEE